MFAKLYLKKIEFDFVTVQHAIFFLIYLNQVLNF